MTIIYLVRHAESAYSPDEYGRGLTEKGTWDAERVANAFTTIPVDVVISSPYKRAIDTVKGVAVAKQLPITLNEHFRERSLADGPVDDFTAAVQAVWNDPAFAHPGGESNQEAQERGVEALLNVIREFGDGKQIVIGTHGNVMALIMQYFDSQYDYHFWRDHLQMPDIYALTFEKEKCSNIKRISLYWQKHGGL